MNQNNNREYSTGSAKRKTLNVKLKTSNSNISDADYLTQLQEEISTIKSKMELESQRHSNDQLNDARLEDVYAKMKILESKSLKQDEVFEKILESMSTRDKRTKELEFKFTLFDKILQTQNEKFKLIENQMTEIRNKIIFNEQQQSKMRDDVVENSSEIHKVTFLQERLDHISELFRGSEFRLSSIEKECGTLDSDFRNLCRTLEYDTNTKINQYNQETEKFNDQQKKVQEKYEQASDEMFRESRESKYSSKPKPTFESYNIGEKNYKIYHDVDKEQYDNQHQKEQSLKSDENALTQSTQSRGSNFVKKVIPLNTKDLDTYENTEGGDTTNRQKLDTKRLDEEANELRKMLEEQKQ